MPSGGTLGAHYVLRQTNPGRTHRLSEVIADAHADELTVRREIDKLALDGQVKRLYVGEHVMLKKTDEFDPENAPDVKTASEQPRPARILDVSEYDPPGPSILDPEENYAMPSGVDELKPLDVGEGGNAYD